jgi:uncharacterized membrane protein
VTRNVDMNVAVSAEERRTAVAIVRATLWFFNHWVTVFSTLLGVLVVLPFLAPVLMQLGWTGPAQLIYAMYSTLCHQMAQRSLFLFGPQPMVNIAQLPVVMTTSESANLLALREFLGSAELGWKVAWSDRMVYMFGATWLAGIAYGVLRRRLTIRPLHWLTFLSLLSPMAIDGGTHFLSDVSGGLVGGFRYRNQWLADLTGNTLPTWFYAGDALGSFNSWARLVSGLLFGLAVVWLAFPYLERSFRDSTALLQVKLASRDARAR